MPGVDEEDIYDPRRVRRLFNNMASTYGAMNLISSFGVAKLWRDQCVKQARLSEGMLVYDWMSGMGECWPAIRRRLGGSGTIVAVDISPEMCARAKSASMGIDVLEEDVLENSLPSESAHCLISTFGLKTFSEPQMEQLARQAWRVLKPGGVFSMLEISVPRNILLRLPYLLYLNYCIPVIGRLFLGNPDHYRMLGIYTEKFRDCGRFQQLMREVGFDTTQGEHFFGCATSVFGRKPDAPP